MQNETTYYLGIDWGKERTGFALADGETRIATAFKDLPSKETLAFVKKISSQMKIEAVVLGFLPIGDKFSSYNSNQVKILENELKKMGLVVILEKENFTTRMAQKNLADAGRKGPLNRDNAEAARILLQAWLDRTIRKC